ncbi:MULTISPECIES: toxin-antitoxin system TumE family protein [Photobacterium]|jgi:hypothetical protein|uniref:Uncharacterized protein n=1 Tax=Photobacterium malacitanum TaxID=2204294 RepID=A0A1Y6MRL4_9GAMM|nr:MULTISPECIES: DUF6516 family protein [Photobacterium]MCD9496703.1 hypothetical protein [Photobacterium carnosum]SMY39102.1 hypothetical protein PMAL9190_03903 [Photobacterium malacitanum]
MDEPDLVGLDMLLELHGTECHHDDPDGYYWRIEAWKIEKNKDRPHGLSYRLTLHNNHNKRIMGYDNAHQVKATKRHKITGVKKSYDHKHRHPSDKGIPYEFESPAKLIEDFFASVDEVLEPLRKKKS